MVRLIGRLGRSGAALLLAALLLVACSTAPKRPAEIFTGRDRAADQLELANQEADRGNYTAALEQLAEARRLALSTDDPPLIVRTGLSLGNILYFLGRREEADEAWQAALAEAGRVGDRELEAICYIYLERAKLLDHLAGTRKADPAAIRDRVQTELGAVKTDSLAQALGWHVIGLAEKELGRWDAAVEALNKALAIHEKGNYLEQAAYDWYLIASVWSVAKDYAKALAALEQALALDRRAENAYGLGSDWFALAEVYTRAGRQSEAQAAYRRAVDIFRAGGFEDAAAQAEARLR
ncbi:MAG: tetratricopeptide repeat protein [Treponema sp.]|nr:tetratricopeptide repeat protein [Treponema sp.]